jgi:hypothetical protein
MARGMSKQTLKIIEACKEILAESSPATVRGVCYQLFVRGLVANMGSKKETDKISGILTRAREKGLISWADIVDETRQAKTVSKWDDIPDYTETVLRAYRKNFWNTQSEWIEVWSEKGTIGGVLAPILKRYAVTYRVFHGYGSATAVHDVAVLTKNHEKAPLTVLYCGDWDPSGMNMSEGDLPERLERYGGNVNITRIALTAHDVFEGNLPSFTAESKKKDPRHKWFVENYGETCFELDAMPANILRDRVEDEILKHIDEDAWDRCKIVEKAEKESMTSFFEGLRHPPTPA